MNPLIDVRGGGREDWIKHDETESRREVRAVPMRVVVTLIATLVLALSVVSRVWGQEPDLHGLDIKAISMCGRALDNVRVPCVVFSKHEEADVLYVAVFTPDGTEMETIIRHDNASGRQAVVWPKVVPDPSAPQYPQQR